MDFSKTVIDPIISEVHRHKQEIAEAFGFDVVVLGRSLQRREIGDSRFKLPSGEQHSSEEFAPSPTRTCPLDYNPKDQ